jgi:hypothetical protein
MSHIQNHRTRTFWILVVVIGCAAIASGLGLKGLLSRQVSAVQPQRRERLYVKDARPVASAIMSLESRFNRVITYEDLPLVHADDVVDVTESVRRDLNKYAPGKAPKVFVPRGGELNLEFNQDDPLEVVLSQVLSESEQVTTSATFRIEQANRIIHIIPHSMKGPTGETTAVRSILEAPVQLPAKERTGMQMLEAWRESVTTNSKKRVIIGAAPFKLLLSYKDDKGLSSQNARDALTEILMRSGKDAKLSWQLLYDPGQKVYAINVHSIR